MESTVIRVTVWGENFHERDDRKPIVREIYPDGMHTAIAQGVSENLADRAEVRTVTMDDPEHGLPSAVLEATDVLVWWGHALHDAVADEVADRVVEQVLDGMGLVALHAAMHSKPFLRLMGTSCNLRWRDADDRELVWVVNPGHPIASGLPAMFVVPAQEMYGEYFDIPSPDEIIFISSFSGGEVFRSGCCFTRGRGRIFYFSPGHETYPVYHQPQIRQVIANAVAWAYVERPAAVERNASLNSPRGWFEAGVESAQGEQAAARR
jgi:trehalose utilization protein